MARPPAGKENTLTLLEVGTEWEPAVLRTWWTERGSSSMWASSVSWWQQRPKAHWAALTGAELEQKGKQSASLLRALVGPYLDPAFSSEPLSSGKALIKFMKFNKEAAKCLGTGPLDQWGEADGPILAQPALGGPNSSLSGKKDIKTDLE